ncbi:hypothetical protein GZH53_13665 [Flavihumibacter sp. R14]|nr:hypothetical protein [Flavihumibacter soli]
MKKIFTLNIVFLIVVSLLFSCKKEPTLPVGVKLPTLSINRISELPFSNTEWKHVFGGMAEVKYIKGTSTIIDSLDLAKLASYQKTLELGTYDVQLRSKSTATADTFIRFSAELKGLVVDQGQAISLTASTNDGLITIKKESVKDNSVPTFTPSQAGAKTYKLGLIDGYYFIYVKAGTTGQVAFDSKATDDPITKNLTIVAANHYNLVVVTSGTSSIRVELQKFTYNEVQVFSTTLITIQPANYNLGPDYEYTFLLADQAGKILSSARYQHGDPAIKLGSKEPYLKDRVSVFMLSKPQNSSVKPRIDAYMNVKKGSTWVMTHTSLPTKHHNAPRPVNLLSVPAYDLMVLSSDVWGKTVLPGQDHTTTGFNTYASTEGSKFFFQVENQGKAFYHFFNIPTVGSTIDIDPALCTTPSLAKNISLPGDGDVHVYAKKDKNFYEDFFLGQKRITGGSGVYFHPNEPFEQYYTLLTYDLFGIYHADGYIGSSIPETTSPLNVSFEANGRSLATFQPTFTGQFDFYRASFENANLTMEVNSPSTAVSSRLVYPDLATFAGFSEFNNASLALKSMKVYDYDGFAENKLNYKTWQNYQLQGKAMSKVYF